jgi:hypothetical protein
MYMYHEEAVHDNVEEERRELVARVIVVPEADLLYTYIYIYI